MANSSENYQDKIKFYQYRITQAIEQLNPKHLAYCCSELERYMKLEVKRQEVLARMDEQLDELLEPSYRIYQSDAWVQAQIEAQEY
jgi:hypothetical protein